MNENLETRVFSASELRLVKPSDDGPARFEGYAAVFNKLSEDLGGFRERIKPKAFSKAIKNSDTRALFNHDSNYVLGRSTSKTLELKEDSKGLKFSCVPPDTSWARDLLVSVDRGDISQCSFGFTLAKGGDEWVEEKGEMRRSIKEVDRLLDISLVTYPAYPDTSVALRNMEGAKTEEHEENILQRMVEDYESNAEITEDDREKYMSVLKDMQARFGEPTQADAEPTAEVEPMQDIPDIKNEECRDYWKDMEEK